MSRARFAWTRLTRAALVAARPMGALACGALGACRNGAALPETPLSGGAATVFDATHDAFSLPAPLLSESHRARFFVGNSFFNQNWLSAPASAASRDGLGPLFNARSCSTCHFKDGRGRAPDAGQALTTALLRISVPGRGPHGEPLPDPAYGDQIQNRALPGVPAEAEVIVEYERLEGAYADGERYTLARPRYRLEQLGYGPTQETLLRSVRVAPALIGLGLLEAVPESALRARVDEQDRDRDGISGRLNRVWDQVAGRFALGRFGWKAEQPSVLQQSAAAFLGDMGLTSTLFARENHTEREAPCRELPSGGSPEVEPEVLEAVASYARSLGVPAAREPSKPEVRRGRALFGRLACGACHLPTLHTEPLADLPELGGQEIHPYTDLLLHDMGDGLADGRPVFEADGREWRTPPLWGIGLVPKVNGHQRLLHDGRARGVAEAILWHGGEAERSRQRFSALGASERGALLAFVESL